MSGHSKWSTIKRKKGETDSQRAKIFTKIGREIAVAVKEGGADPSINGKLRELIAKAKSNNVPNDNVDRAIKKAAGDDQKNDYLSITYEGYGPQGVAVIVDTLTDNRNRTAADVRHYFDKYGGNMGTSGCVSFMFAEQGLIYIQKDKADFAKLMEDAIEAGAEDLIAEEDGFVVVTAPNDLRTVGEILAQKGYPLASSALEKVPDNFTTITGEDALLKMEKLLELLEDNDDVQNVWHNWENQPNE